MQAIYKRVDGLSVAFGEKEAGDSAAIWKNKIIKIFALQGTLVKKWQ